MTPGLMIAAPASGTGKTTVMLGLLRALPRRRARGAAVQERARLYRSGLPPRRQRPRLVQPRQLGDAGGDARHASRAKADDADLALAEGSMGLFDGVAEAGRDRQRRERRHRAPDGLAGRAGDRRLGPGAVGRRDRARLRRYDPERADRRRDPQPGREPAPRTPGAQRDGGGRHPRVRRAAAARRPEAARAPSRAGAGGGASRSRRADRRICRHSCARMSISPRSATPRPPARGRHAATQTGSPRRHSGSRWRRTPPSPSSIRTCSKAGGAAGAEILPFSPLADEAPAADADLVWLPGGYPELHAGTLAAARPFHAGLRRARRRPARSTASAAATWRWARR